MNKPSPQEKMRYRFNADIPAHYDDVMLGAMFCNPHRLFVYWELPEQLYKRDQPLLLRLSESGSQTTAGGSAVEIEVPPGENAHYIEVPFPGLAYTVELFGIASEGSRKKLLSARRLAPVTAPAAQPQAVVSPPGDTPHHADAGEQPSGAPERLKQQTDLGFVPDINPRLLNPSSRSLPG
ncbi:MAG: DUF4912 domain-containing protein [Chitinispirillaceae bacterium]|nr:DUF4912 domain-containing protein [Chitinispirillaceae bacterium]